MTIQIDRAVDAAGVKGRAGGVVAQKDDRFAAGSLRLERLVHGVVGGFADLGEVCFRYAVSAVAIRRSSRAFDQIGARVTAERAAGDLDDRLGNVGDAGQFAGRRVVAARIQLASDRTAGDLDLRNLIGIAIVHRGNSSVDRAAADLERGV